MLIGAHAILYSTHAEADRAFLRDVLRLPNIDAGGGWLIFGLPPAEVAVHPSDTAHTHEIYFMCADVEAFVRAMQERGFECSSVRDEGWGLLTHLRLPGGGRLGVYQPRHARPEALLASSPSPKRAAKGAKERRRKKKPRKTSAGRSPRRKGG